MEIISNFMHSDESLDQTNFPILTIMYKYVVQLSKDQLSASLLVHSIHLKTNADIHIRNEASQQLERFEKVSGEQTKDILEEFFDSVRQLFLAMNNPMLKLFVENNSKLQTSLCYNQNLIRNPDREFMNEIMDLSSYALKFYIKNKSHHEQVERLLLLNLH